MERSLSFSFFIWYVLNLKIANLENGINLGPICDQVYLEFFLNSSTLKIMHVSKNFLS